jgi:hypothetical protein
MKKSVEAWTKNRDDLMLQINEQDEFAITDRGRLLAKNCYESMEQFNEQLEEGEQIIERFFLPVLAIYHTTDYLRFAFDELYPDKDFDATFETDQPGVVDRIRELGYGGIEDKARELRFEALEEKLDELGYKLELWM